MSNQATKARNNRIKTKHSMKTNIRKMIYWVIFIYLIWLIVQSLNGTRTVYIVNSTVLAAQNEQEGVKIEQYDPCGLKEVQCDTEQEENAPQVKFEAKKEIVEKIKKAFPENPELMVAIAMGESGLNPATPPNGNPNGTSDTGIFRINSVHGYSEAYLTDIDNNIKIARKIYEKQGIVAWVAYKNGSYKKFM